MMTMRRVVALFDVHFPENIPLGGVIKFIRDWKPTHLILGGDFLDLACIRKWSRTRREVIDAASHEFHEDMKQLQSDFKGANNLLDQIDSALPARCDKYYLQGNHETWLFNIKSKLDCFKDQFDPRSNLRLSERGYTWKEENICVNVGRCYFQHGQFHNIHYTKKTLIAARRNIVVGHKHTEQVFSANSFIDRETIKCYGVPGLCHRNPDYKKSRAVTWSNGFFIMYSDPVTNYFWPYIITIVKDQFVAPNGQLYK